MSTDPASAELTTEQAADLLNVSREYLVKLLDECLLPACGIGDRRTMLVADVLDYKRRDDAKREEILDALTQEGERLGLSAKQAER